MNKTGWRPTQLGQVCEKPQYGYTASARREPIGPKFLRITDLREGRIDWDSVPFCELSDEELVRYRLSHGDILVARIGATTGSTSIVIDPPNSVFASYLIRLRANDEAHPFFLYFYTMDAQFRNWIDAHKDSNLKGGVNVPVLLAAPLALPSPNEQEKIAAVLWKLQRAIATQDRLIATTRDLKQSAMHRLFTHGLRGEPLQETAFGPQPQSWDVIPISKLGQVITGSTPKTAKAEYYANGELHFIAPGDIGGSTEIGLTTKKITEAGMQVSRHLPRGSTCVVCIGSSIGKVGITTQDRSTTNQQINAVVPSTDFDHFYVCQLLQHYSELIASRAAPSPVPILSKSQFSQIELPVTFDLDEQRDIAAALTTIDRKLAHHHKKRAALNDLFQTLLDKLMTGEIRVADIDIDTSEIAAPSGASA